MTSFSARSQFAASFKVNEIRRWQGVIRRNFVKIFDTDKTRMIGLLYGEKNYDNMLNRFHLIPERYGQTDAR